MAGEDSAGRGVSRRAVLQYAVLVLGAGTAAGSLGGCGLRLEDDAPSLPLLPRKSVPDEAALVDATRRTSALAQEAGRIPGPPAAVTRIAANHATQAQVLRARLTAAGVPNHVIDATPTTAPTAAVSAPPVATVPGLAAAEVEAVSRLLPVLPTATPANRPVLASVVAALAAAADELGRPVPWPAADPLPPAAATTLLTDSRAAAYALQVVTAQSSGDLRARAGATYAALAARNAELAAMAGGSASPAPLGYVLPFPVTTAEEATRLVTQVLASVVASGLAPLGQLPASTATTTLVRLLVDAQRVGRPWGLPALPFPGMTYP